MLFRIFTVVAVIALAISTWILSSPARRPLASQRAAGAELPGYYLKNAVMVDYDETGKPSIRLEADRIDQIAHGTEVALSHVRVRYETPAGQKWVMIGDTAHVEPGGKIIDVAGNVRLSSDGTARAGTTVVRTDALTYNVPETLVTTEDDVRIDFGTATLNAHGLVANLKERTMRLESRVNGRFQR